MQRTYGRRALRRQKQDEHDDNSPSRKRQKVFVETISPRRKKALESLTTTQPEPTSRGTSESPKTPERSPKDSSSLYTTPSHHSRPSSQAKRGSIVKRMLGRSKTDSSLEATPSATGVPSVPRQASFHSLPTTFPETETTPDASSQSSPKPLPPRHIKTYAGSSRSFLVALPVPQADSLNTPEDDTEQHESYTDLRTRWGIDLSEDDPQPCLDEQAAAPTPLKRNASELSQPSLPAGMMNDLKSITELRSKGESRRFLDEIGYLFEGMDSSSAIGLRRASALEIVNKLCDPDFNRRAKTSDFYVHTWEKLSAARAGTSDKIFDATIAFFASLAARDSHTLIEVAQQREFIPTLLEILSSFDYKKDVLASALAGCSDEDLKACGILRTEIPALRSLAKLVSKESSVNQPSGRFFISHSLAALTPSLLTGQYLPTVLDNLRAELGLLEPRIAAYESGLSLFPLPGTNRDDMSSLCHIEGCLRLLDSYLLGHWNSDGDSASSALSHMRGFTAELMSLCVVSSALLEENEEEVSVARRCLCGALRLLTLLSHADPWWCDAALEVSHALPFVTMIAMRSQAKWSALRNTESKSISVEAFDLLCLALGLVMNWATLSSAKVAALSRNDSINRACPGSRLCARACQCPGQRSVLECFATLHAQYADDCKDDPPERTFLRGYTAILLGLLIRDDPSNQSIVLLSLPGLLPYDKIRSLISHCHSFLDLYTDTTPLPSPDSPRATPEVVTREASDRYRAAWDEKGKEIAQSVISSLGTLCDT